MIKRKEVLFGDLRGMYSQDIHTFVQAAGCPLRKSYPNSEAGSPDEEVIRKTHQLLAEAGIPDLLPATICSSPRDRASQILLDCHQWQVRGEDLYIIDRDPHALVRAIESYPEAAVLRSATVVGLSSRQPFDYPDMVTGIRLVGLSPATYPFPIHPTPAS